MSSDLNPIEWITTTEAAEMTGYTADYFRKAIKRGLLQGQKRGRDWFLSKEEVLAYAEEMKNLGPDKHNPWRTGARHKHVMFSGHNHAEKGRFRFWIAVYSRKPDFRSWRPILGTFGRQHA